MDIFPIAWGLDIGSSSIKAVKIARKGAEVTVLGYAMEPVAHVPEGENRDEAVDKALASLSLREEFGDTPVIAALSGRSVYTKSVNIPVLNPKNVDKMVELEARQQIPGNFDELEWRYHMSPAADGASNDVAIFAVRREVGQELIQRCKRVGINLVGISVSSLALYNFVRFDQTFPDDETVMILDVGGENTDLVLYQGETLWMRSLPVSGNDVTKAFMKKFRVSFEEAETLKRQTGDSRQADKIIKVIEGSLNELTSEVQRSLGFYKTTNTNAKLENLVISGSTFRLPGLPEYLAERLRYTINILEDLDKIKVASGLERDHFLHDLQSLGVAMGLALQGTGAAKTSVNLMPSSLRVQKILRTKRWAAVACLALIGVASVTSYLVQQGVLTENARLAGEVKEALEQNKKDSKASTDVLAKVPDLANALAAYRHYGAQKGVVYAGFNQVIEAIDGVARELGPTPDTELARQKLTGAEAKLQAVYLQRIEVPPPPPGADPFQPLASDRVLVVEVAVPLAAKPDAVVVPKLLSALRAMPVPAALAAVHRGKTLFAEVQALSQIQGTIAYNYIDLEHLNDKGDKEAVKKEVRVPVQKVTLQCVLSAGAPVVAVAPTEVKP